MRYERTGEFRSPKHNELYEGGDDGSPLVWVDVPSFPVRPHRRWILREVLDSDPPQPEPVYRTAQELEDAIMYAANELETLGGLRRAVRGLIARYQPEPTLDADAIGKAAADEWYEPGTRNVILWQVVADTIRAAMGVKK